MTHSRAIPMQRVFDDLFDSFFKLTPTTETYPPANVYTDGKRLFFELAVAGYSIADLKIEVKDNRVIISGNPEAELDVPEGTRFWERKIARRKFERSWILGNLVNIESCSASFNDGLLTVTFDIIEEAKPKQITIASAKQLTE